jgi:hypothetical protein
MEKLFVVGTATFTAFDPTTEQVVLRGTSLLDSTLKTSLSQVEIRGGRGNVLLANYWHSSKMELTISNPVFEMSYLAAAVGSVLQTSGDVYYNESVLIGASGTGTVSGATPLAVNGTTAYGWLELSTGVWERVTFSGSTFASSSGVSGQTLCCKYFALNSSAKQIVVSSHIVPSILRVVLEADLASNEAGTNIVGSMQIVVPKVQFSGAMELNLKSDGYVTTPLNGTALESPAPANSGCTVSGIYCYLNQIKTSALWYDGLLTIGIVSGDFALAVGATKTLVVKGVFSDNTVATISNALLTFSSSDGAKATAGANTGLITGISAGPSVIHVTPVAAGASQFDAEVTVTVS